MVSAFVPLAKGYEDLEAVTIIDILRRGNFDVSVYSISDSLEVVGARNTVIRAEGLMRDVSKQALEEYDIVVLPGGGEGACNLSNCQLLLEFMQSRFEKGLWIAGICASPAVVLKAHNMLGEKATCYPSFSEELGDTYSSKSVVISGKVITSQAVGTAIEFSLAIIELFCGLEEAKLVADSILIKYSSVLQ